MHRPPVCRRIGVLARQEQRAALRLSHCRGSIQCARWDVAVGSVRKWIEFPVVLMCCHQRVPHLLLWKTEHLSKCGARFIAKLIRITTDQLRRTRSPCPPGQGRQRLWLGMRRPPDWRRTSEGEQKADCLQSLFVDELRLLPPSLAKDHREPFRRTHCQSTRMSDRQRLRLNLHSTIAIHPLQHAQRQCHDASRRTKGTAARLDNNLTFTPTHRSHNAAEPNLTTKLPHTTRKIDGELRIAAAHMPCTVALNAFLSFLLQP